MTAGPRDITDRDKKKLYALSGNHCSNPSCEAILVPEGEIPDSHGQLGKIAHIRGANEGSARYDPRMTDDQRRSFDNLILLCPTCHEKIDDGQLRDDYPVKLLLGWKRLSQKVVFTGEKTTPNINVTNSPGSVATINQIGDNVIGAQPVLSVLQRNITGTADGRFQLELLAGSDSGLMLMNPSIGICFREAFDDADAGVRALASPFAACTDPSEEVSEDKRRHRYSLGSLGAGQAIAVRFIFPNEPEIVSESLEP